MIEQRKEEGEDMVLQYILYCLVELGSTRVNTRMVGDLTTLPST